MEKIYRVRNKHTGEMFGSRIVGQVYSKHGRIYHEFGTAIGAIKLSPFAKNEDHEVVTYQVTEIASDSIENKI